MVLGPKVTSDLEKNLLVVQPRYVPVKDSSYSRFPIQLLLVKGWLNLTGCAFKRFRPVHVKEAMHNIVAEYLHGKEYKGEDCTDWCRDISTLVKNRVKG